MRTQIFLIDPLEKLIIKKDSTLLLAHTVKEKGGEALIAFENEVSIDNTHPHQLKCYSFTSRLVDGTFLLDEFKVSEERIIDLDSTYTLHLRKDPPFNRSYLQLCWILRELKKSGCQVLNNPDGVLLNNEKLLTFSRTKVIPTYLGADQTLAMKFIDSMLEKGVTDFIFKPIDLYQGIGVEKVPKNADFSQVLQNLCNQFEGRIMIQPFVEAVTKGEIRSIFYNEKHIGSIIKIPKEGSFLANIAQGATYKEIALSSEVMSECLEISAQLNKQGVPFVAYDILDDKISESNITCPGLLVEVSNALKKNICELIVDELY